MRVYSEAQERQIQQGWLPVTHDSRRNSPRRGLGPDPIKRLKRDDEKPRTSTGDKKPGMGSFKGRGEAERGQEEERRAGKESPEPRKREESDVKDLERREESVEQEGEGRKGKGRAARSQSIGGSRTGEFEGGEPREQPTDGGFV